MGNKFQKNPLLTIGIPTYNRAKLLENALDSYVNQINSLDEKGLVELVISDNNSTDNTTDIVADFSISNDFIHYYKNETNIGANNNILKIGYELAKGKYCWIVGDDDLLREGGIRYFIDILNKINDIGIVFINHTIESDEDREYVKNNNIIEISKAMCSRQSDCVLNSAQEILNYTTHNALFTALPEFIFLTEIWKKNFFGYQHDGNFESLTNTFPHSVILAKDLVSDKVYYAGHPYLAFFTGAQTWFSEWKFVYSMRVLQLSELFEEYGASKDFLKDYRDRIFSNSLDSYKFKINMLDSPKWFRLNVFANSKKYYTYQTYRNLLLDTFTSACKLRIKNMLRLIIKK